MLTVRVEVVSRADAPATLLAETHEPFGTTQVPIPFSLQEPVTAIDPRMSRAVRAIITVGGELRFRTKRHHEVLTRGGAVLRLELRAADVPAPCVRDEPDEEAAAVALRS